MKKGIILAFCLLFLAVPCSFAGDTFIFAPVISAPAPGEMDSYVISGDNGSEVIHVISLEPTTKDAYLVVGPDGESNVVIKFD
jgi:hypothetical protein